MAKRLTVILVASMLSVIAMAFSSLDVRDADENAILQQAITNSEGEQIPTLCGIVLNDPSARYVSSFPATADAQLTNLLVHNNLDATGNAIYVDGMLYVQSLYTESSTGISTVTQSIFDTKSWELVEVRENLDLYSAAVSMAYDKTTGTVYGYFFDDPSNGSQRFSFGTMNLATGKTSSKFLLYEEDLVVAMAVSNDGRLYGVNSNGMFVEINKETGEKTNIGHTDIHPRHLQSATFDSQTNKFYWASIDDTGKSIIYDVDITTGKPTIVTTFPNGEEFVGLYVMPGETPAGAPSPATELGFDFINDNLSGNITFTMPELAVDNTPLSGNLTAHATIDGKGYSYTGAPGEKCAIPVELSSNGMKLLSVVVSNEAGNSEAAKAEKWIGVDNPAMVNNLTLTSEGSMAILTWEAPTEGRNGGYINPDELTYEITQWGSETSFIEGHTDTRLEVDFTGKVIAELKYSVRAVYNGRKSEPAYSNSISFVQSVFDVPYTFDLNSNFSLCTVVDANNDENTWTKSYNGLLLSGSTHDDWLILPAFNLEKGKLYETNVTAKAKSALNYELFEMRMGKANSVEDLNTLLSTHKVNSKNWTNNRDTITVDANGQYFFAIRAVSTSGKQFTLGDFIISVLTNEAAPKGVTELKATAGENGVLEATIEFIMPSTTEGGAEITTPLSAEIRRGDVVITTLTDLAAGSTQSYFDNGASQGENTYSVTVSDENGYSSVTSECTVKCGVDVPNLPTNVKLVDLGGQVKLTWEHPEVGTNGGYIDPETLVYTIYEPNYGMPVAENVQGTEFILGYKEVSGQSMLAFAIGVENVAGANPNRTISNSVILGDPFGLPLEESFDISNLPWFTIDSCTIEGHGWNGTKNTGANGSIGYSYFTGSGAANEEGSFISPKLSLKGATNPILHFYCMSATQETDTLKVEISTDFNGTYEVINVINFVDLAAEQWHDVTIPLNEYIETEYIHVSFHALPDNAKSYTAICIDEITIRDMKPYDLSALSLKLDAEELKVGEKTTATVTLRNIGSETATPDKYQVKLYADERCVDTVDGIAIEPYTSGSVQLEFAPQVTDSDIVKMRAEIVLADDADVTNNNIEGKEIWIYKPERPAVTDLYATVEAGVVNLSWSCPDLSGDPIMTRTDDFESYRPYAINSAGLWTIYDIDGQVINTPYYFPGWDKAVGFMVLNSELTAVSDGVTLSDIWPAYSGEQFMATFSPSSGDNDDWLITPQLSGNAQTITFYARGGRESLGRERMEIYVSSTDNDINSMTMLLPEAVMVDAGVWTKYSYEVPEGTLYFGIRCTSHARESLHIDDVTYESAARSLDVTFVGYNVYCDGQLMNSSPIAETSYTGNISDGEIYKVRVVYDLGESDDSNEVLVSDSGIDNLYGGKTIVTTEYYDLSGRRIATVPANTFVIVRTIYDDGTFDSEKKILNVVLK